MRRPYGVLLALTCSILMLLPFVTTFDDLLTSFAMRLHLDGSLQWVVPLEARMVAALLSLTGTSVAAFHSDVVIVNGGYPQTLFISWNCIGWQSLVLLGLSLASGLNRTQSRLAQVQLLLVGVLGTVLVNVVRISLVCLLAARAGYVPAVLFHDYGGTLMVLGWLLAFWAVSYRWLLPQSVEAVAA